MPKFGLPLLFAILATALFNCMPVALGRGMVMYGAFAMYAGFILVLSQLDRRVLGYAVILTASNASGGLAPLSYSLLLAMMIVIKDFRYVQEAWARLVQYRWALFLALAAVTALVSVPFWSHEPREFATDFKQYLSRLPYLVFVALAVAVSIQDWRDCLRATFLACVFTAGTVGGFYFLGDKGVPAEYAWNIGMFSYDEYIQLGQAYMAFTRTQMCIVLAVVAAASMAITVATFPRVSAIASLATSGLCVYLIMQLASTGSAFAMVVGMGVAGMGFVLSRPSAAKICISVALLAILGTALLYAVFQTDNFLAKRIEMKQRAGQIDRLELWIGAVQNTVVTPLGRGWTTEFAPRRHTHNDFLSYFISFGWISGLLYFSAGVALGIWYLKRLFLMPSDATDARAMVLAGLAALCVYGVNSMLDMLSAGIGNFQAVWVVILTPAVVYAVNYQQRGYATPIPLVGVEA